MQKFLHSNYIDMTFKIIVDQFWGNKIFASWSVDDHFDRREHYTVKRDVNAYICKGMTFKKLRSWSFYS